MAGLQPGKSLRGNGKGVDPLLRCKAGMGADAADVQIERENRWSCQSCSAHRAAQVKDIRTFRGDLGKVKLGTAAGIGLLR